jgi:hypothetical protein
MLHVLNFVRLNRATEPLHGVVKLHYAVRRVISAPRIALLLPMPKTSLNRGDLMTQGMEWLLIAWGVVTGILLILLFYRSTLTRQEDDQLFIDESSSSRATEQSQLIAKVNKINPLVKLVGATSGLMILAIAGWAVYLGLNSV